MPKRIVSDSQRAVAKAMRRRMTDAEFRLWLRLRDGGLGQRFRRQAPIGPFVADFFCPAAKLIVEVDGSQHNHPLGEMADARRTSWLAASGYQVLRFTNRDVRENLEGVLESIADAMAERLPTPPPRNREAVSTLHQGEGSRE